MPEPFSYEDWEAAAKSGTMKTSKDNEIQFPRALLNFIQNLVGGGSVRRIMLFLRFYSFRNITD